MSTKNPMSFQEALYTNDSIQNVLSCYIESLRNSDRNRDLLHANKLNEYLHILTNPNCGIILQKLFDSFSETLSNDPTNLRFRIAARRKSLLSLERKIITCIDTNKSLDKINDLLGIRIILLSSDIDKMDFTLNDYFDDNIFKDNNTIDKFSLYCFKVLQELFPCCLKQGFTLCEEDSEKEQFTSLKFHDSSEISSKLSHLSYGITDYITKPKANGYQSLHCNFRNMVEGIGFELQIRTFSMHSNAITSHSTYKEDKYGDCLEIDRSKILIPGYKLLSNNTIIDLSGLEHSVEIAQRNNNF